MWLLKWHRQPRLSTSLSPWCSGSNLLHICLCHHVDMEVKGKPQHYTSKISFKKRFLFRVWTTTIIGLQWVVASWRSPAIVCCISFMSVILNLSSRLTSGPKKIWITYKMYFLCEINFLFALMWTWDLFWHLKWA